MQFPCETPQFGHYYQHLPSSIKASSENNEFCYFAIELNFYYELIVPTMC